MNDICKIESTPDLRLWWCHVIKSQFKSLCLRRWLPHLTVPRWLISAAVTVRWRALATPTAHPAAAATATAHPTTAAARVWADAVARRRAERGGGRVAGRATRGVTRAVVRSVQLSTISLMLAAALLPPSLVVCVGWYGQQCDSTHPCICGSLP